MAIREGTVFWGVSPHFRAYRTTGVERGGLGGILPPHSRAYVAPPAPMTVAADNLGPKVELTQAFLTLRVPF